MAKIKHTITTEDSIIESANDIFIFSTKNYIGIWNKDIQKYNIIKKEVNSLFHSDFIFFMDDIALTLDEFYEQVNIVTNEELEEVYNFNAKAKIEIRVAVKEM